MASQIAHIIYAKKYFDSFELVKIKDLNDAERLVAPGGKINRDEFMLGCIFPDIRHIGGNIKRKDTHFKFAPLDLDFSGLDSFQAGWKFHLYCDMRREEILNRNAFYSLKHAADFCNLPAKILEDELIYENYDNWEKISHFFNNPPEIKLDLEIETETFRLWYAIVAKYIEKKPEEKSMRIFLSKQPTLANHVEIIMKSVAKLKENKKVVEILKKVKEEII